MNITLNLKLSHQKDSDYIVNLDIDPERIEPQSSPNSKNKTQLGAIKRPDADRLKILRNPELAEEDKATEAVMDKLEME